MRIAIIGCGAVGSLFAANLARLDDVDVWAYDVARDHVGAMNEQGLHITGEEDFVARLQATVEPEELPNCDFGIVATKSLYTADAIAAVAPKFQEGSVCSVQNGVGNEEIIAEHVPHVIRGTTFPAGRVMGPGTVSWDTKGDTWLGPFEPQPAPMEAIRELAATLSRAGMTSHALDDARGAQWTKLIFNAASNPVGALTGLSHGRVCDIEATRDLVSELINEGVAVAETLGIELHSDPEEMIDHAAEVAYEHRASMLQDVQARRRTEVDFMNGGIARFGREVGVETPLNEAIWSLIKGLEYGWEHQPEG